MIFYVLGGLTALGGFAAMFSGVAPWCNAGPLMGATVGAFVASIGPWFQKPRQ